LTATTLVALYPTARAQTALADGYVYVPLGSSPSGFQAGTTDGTWVAGARVVPDYVYYRGDPLLWDVKTGTEFALDSGGAYSAIPQSVGAGIVLGTARESQYGDLRACVWDLATGARRSLGVAGFTYTTAYGADENVIVGSASYSSYSAAGPSNPVVWDRATGAATVLSISGMQNGNARAVSGNFAVGDTSSVRQRFATSWDLTTGVQRLLDATGFTYSGCMGISGNVAVGYGDGSACAWDVRSGNQLLLDRTNLAQSYANGISGNLIVGRGYGGTAFGWAQQVALVWDVTTGQRFSLLPFIPGPDGFWTYNYAQSISADGTIVGYNSEVAGQEVRPFVLRPLTGGGWWKSSPGRRRRFGGALIRTPETP
jgi:hypothetical protein